MFDEENEIYVTAKGRFYAVDNRESDEMLEHLETNEGQKAKKEDL